MKEFMRIVGITIEGIKNVCHGSIKINTTNNTNEEDLSKSGSILGIYGQNGSGKSTILEATDILKAVITGKNLPDYVGSMINTTSKKARLEYNFYIEFDDFKGFVDYEFNIALGDNDKYVINHEKLSLKKFEDSEWKRKRILFEAENGEITYSKIKKAISKDTNMFSKLLYEINPDASLIFGSGTKDRVAEELAKKERMTFFV